MTDDQKATLAQDISGLQGYRPGETFRAYIERVFLDASVPEGDKLDWLRALQAAHQVMDENDELLRSLAQSRADSDASDLHLSNACARAVRHKAELVESAGEFLSVAQVAALLSVSEEDVEADREVGKVLAVDSGFDHLTALYYPAFQFQGGKVVEGLADLIAAHKGASPWIVLDDLLAPNEAWGGRRLIDVLRAGERQTLDRHIAQMEGDGFA